MDVARKLVILARTSGHDVDMKNVNVSPFIPRKYFARENIELFINSTKELDEDFSIKTKKAKENGGVLRYVARLDSRTAPKKLSVSLQEVSKNSSLGKLEGNLNKIIIVSNNYALETPYSVEAPGAGLEVTAQNIRRDLLYQLKERKNY